MPKKWIRFTTVPLLLILTACDLGPNLEVRTFQVETTDAEQLQSVGVLIQPYVYKDRPNAPGSMSVSTAANAITVRETPDNLDRIERVLAELTFPPSPNSSFRLHFQFVEANGATEPDPAIADVVEELRRTFRFTGYSLTGEAVIAATPNEKFAHELQTQTDGRSYSISGNLTDPDHTLRVRFTQKRTIGPRTFTDGTVLSTSVGIRPGQTLVLGSVPVEGTGTLLVIARMIEGQG